MIIVRLALQAAAAGEENEAYFLFDLNKKQ
jgi:hypothetical protein